MRVWMRRRSSSIFVSPGPTASHARACAHLAAGLTRHRLAPAAEAREEVLQLRELDLRLALPALGVLAEDVEDDRRAVDDLDLDDVLERTPLVGGELGVGDDGVGAERLRRRASARRPCPCRSRSRHPGGGRRCSSPSSTTAPAVSARAASSRSEFSASVGAALRIHADEHDVLEAQLPVLDLGDVLQLGRQAGDAAERRHGPRARTDRRRNRRSRRKPCHRRAPRGLTRHARARRGSDRALVVREDAIDGVGMCGRHGHVVVPGRRRGGDAGSG